MNDEKNEIELHKNKKDKLPFAVFVMPTNSIDNKIEDYKQIFTDIISDRIKENTNKTKQKFVLIFQNNKKDYINIRKDMKYYNGGMRCKKVLQWMMKD